MAVKEADTYILACQRGELIRSTYYADTYRTELTVDGVQKLCDVMYIRIPFSPLKEAQFMQRFNLSREELPGFYKSFQRAVANHVKTAQELYNTQNPTILKSFVSYIAARSFRREDKDGKRIGSDIFLISEPMDNFVNSEHFSAAGASLRNIVYFGTRMLQAIKTLNDRGYSLGAIDIDSCYLAAPEGDAQSAKPLLKNGYLFYALSPDSKVNTYGNPDVIAQYPLEIAMKLADGTEKPSMDTDIRMLSCLLWKLLSGKHYTDPVDLDTPPIYAPEELQQYLVKGITEGSNAYRELNAGLHGISKQMTQGLLADMFIPMGQPVYAQNPMPEPRAEEVVEEEEPEEPTKEEEKKDSGKKKKKTRKKALPVFILAFLLIGFLMFRGQIMSMLSPTTDEPAESTPVPTANIPKGPYSSESGLYLLDGEILNADGSVNQLYVLDDDGNIVEPGTSEILYYKQNISPYITINAVKIGILEKDYSPDVPEPIKALFKDTVVDLRNIAAPYKSGSNEPFEIYDMWIENFGIKDGSMLLVKKDVAKDEEDGIVLFLVSEETVAPEVKEEAESEAPAEDAAEAEESGEAENGETAAEPEAPETPEAKLVATEVTDFEERALYKAQGKWRYKVQLKADPSDVTNRKLTLKSMSPDLMRFVVDQDGKETYSKAIKVSFSSKGIVEITVECSAEGRYLMSVSSADDLFSKAYALTFEAPEGAPVPLPSDEPEPEDQPPAPTPTPWATATPAPEATPEPTPTPTPAPTQPPSGGGGGGGGGGSYIAPVPSQQPVQTPAPVTTPEPSYPDEDPEPLPSWEPTFTLDPEETEFTIKVGEKIILSPSLGCTIRVDKQGIVSYPNVVPFEITGAAPGDVTITFTCTYAALAGQKIEIVVHVVE